MNFGDQLIIESQSTVSDNRLGIRFAMMMRLSIFDKAQSKMQM